MPHLIRVYIKQVALGFLISAVFVGVLLGMNVGNLWHLIKSAPGGTLALLLLWVFNGIVFAGVQFALALHSGPDKPGGGKREDQPQITDQLVPVRIDR